MTIDQKQTIYRRDYVWPIVKTLSPKAEQLPQYCLCDTKKEVTFENSAPVPPTEQNWSRLGPMGPLLDAAAYPIFMGEPPESDISYHNQPNAFLSKLQDKYPLLFDCDQRRSDDFIARINKDRLRSTYQVDFGKDAPLTYEDLMRIGGPSGDGPCPPPRELPGDPCKHFKKPIAFRPGLVSGAVGGAVTSRNDKRKGYCAGGLPLTNGLTEYQDTISRWGLKHFFDSKNKKRRLESSY